MARAPATAAPTFFAEHFRALGTPARAAAEKAYLKSPLRFHGVTVPEIRRACADFCQEHRGLDRERLRAEVDALMQTDFHDLRSAAIGVLERARAQLTADDLTWLVGLVRHTGNWAHVDWLATKIIGPLVTGHRRAPALLRAWAADPDLWVRRTALIAQLDALRKGGGDFDLFASVAVPMLAEREFFVRKAIGWVLRDVSKRRPELVRDFVLEHGARASALTFREATRCLPLAMRAGLPGPARQGKAVAASPAPARAPGRPPKGLKREVG
ncbi:MAG TPA: DNA alkylation repair protein [Polyangiaceae bacterium]|nr:DNA alkylation repair protein [Polyangiaceae bacterium]